LRKLSAAGLTRDKGPAGEGKKRRFSTAKDRQDARWEDHIKELFKVMMLIKLKHALALTSATGVAPNSFRDMNISPLVSSEWFVKKTMMR
jgi:hypothetical protein